jgi:hypothetical protein
VSVQESQYQPLAGDPDHLQQMAAHYLDIADAIQRTIPVLRSMHDDASNTSKATDALKGSTDKVADDIAKAENRYRVTAQALLSYVPRMRTAKDTADTAAANISYYTEQVTTTSTKLTTANDTLKSADDDGKDDATKAQKTAQTAADDAQASLVHWQQVWNDHAGNRNDAAMTAVGLIVDVVENNNNGLINPHHHWWDSVVKFVAAPYVALAKGVAWVAGKAWQGVKWVGSHFEEIAAWAGVAAVFLGWVPGLGTALILISVAGACLKMGKDIAAGKWRDWKTMLGDSLGIALSAWGPGLTKYVGKLGKFEAMTKVMSGGKYLARFKSAGNFEKVMGGSWFKMALYKSSSVAKPLDGMLKPGGLKQFMKEVGASPVKFEMKSIKGEAVKFVKSYGGLNIPKLSTATGMHEGINVLREMGGGKQAFLVAMDGRKVISNVQTLTNAGIDLAHGDGGLTQSPLSIKPEQVVVNNLLPDKVSGGQPPFTLHGSVYKPHS